MKQGTKNVLNGVWSFAKGMAGKANPAVGAGMLVGEVVVKSAIMTVDKVKNHFKKNVNSKVGGEGNIDWAEILGSITGLVIVLAGVYMFVTGQISIDDLINLKKKTD